MWLANGRVWVCFGGMTGLPLRTISIWTMMVLCAVATAGCMGALAPEEMETGPKRTYSKLWGRQGEVWLPGGRLPDFSYAGYRSGEREIPDYPVATDVTAFGARGDDDADDTAAFKAAIAATEAGAVFVPAGRYVITEVLRITKPGVVLRGEDGGRTRLFFPKPLQEIEPNTGATTGGRVTSNYAWSGGFVRFQGSLGSKVLTPITAQARRGAQVVTVKDAGGLKAGQTVEVFMKDTPENTLIQHLYDGESDDVSQEKGRTRVSLVTKITSIEGDRVHLERRLRFDVKAEWTPVLRAFEPTVQDSGVEDMVFEFPVTPYGGHFTEVGYNPVTFVNVAHCWARRVKFVNADSGPMVGGVFNTVSDAVFESVRPKDNAGNQGHHGIFLQHTGDHLFTRFDIRMKFVHDISVSRCAGVVVSQGKGLDLCFDHHKQAPYEILFTAVDLGQGTRPWRSGGGAALGRHAGARVTFWNLRADGTLPEPPKYFGPWSMNFVGANFGRPPVLDAAGRWREEMIVDELRPSDLHASQLRRRLTRE